MLIQRLFQLTSRVNKAALQCLFHKVSIILADIPFAANDVHYKKCLSASFRYFNVTTFYKEKGIFEHHSLKRWSHCFFLRVIDRWLKHWFFVQAYISF